MRLRSLAKPLLPTVIIGLLAGGGLVLAAAVPWAPSASAQVSSGTPTYLLTRYTKIGGNIGFKCDLAAELPEPPEVVIFGGSRATRFRPSDFTTYTGLSAVNVAVGRFRPEDAWAITNFLYAREPRAALHGFFAVEVTTFRDDPLRQGLLYDKRLSRWFPADLIARQKQLAGPPHAVNIRVGVKRFSRRGLLLWNHMDERRAEGVSVGDILDAYIRNLLPKASDTTPVKRARSRLYFEKTIKLFNKHGVVPAVVIMPYHPIALARLREAGWQTKLDDLRQYLRALQSRCQLKVVDLVEIESFGGSPDEFYDGSHVTMENARRIIRHVATVAPECFRMPAIRYGVPKKLPGPTLSPSSARLRAPASLSRAGSDFVAARPGGVAAAPICSLRLRHGSAQST